MMVYRREPAQLGAVGSGFVGVVNLIRDIQEKVREILPTIITHHEAQKALEARGVVSPHRKSIFAKAWDLPIPIKVGAVSILVLAVILIRRQARRRRERRQVISNPRVPGHLRSKVEEARKFRKGFHWGIDGNKVSKHRISKPPKVAVKLGQLHSVVYKTKKRGEPVQFFEHEFENNKPMLAMDIDNRRLHIVGGGYTVTDDGITG